MIIARTRLYWATLAYQKGEYADARRLMREALAADPWKVLAEQHGWIRSAACMASLLPDPLHHLLGRIFNRATAR